MNEVTILGRLTADPEVKTTAGGKSVCRFTVAVQKPKKDGADFIPCTAWEGTAEFVGKWFKKGKFIAVHGSLQTNSYEKDGKKTSYLDVLCRNAYFTEGRAQAPEEQTDYAEADDGDLPF